MDSGDVIPGLNEDWTFMGCKAMEWMAGFMTSLLVANGVDKPAHSMPLLVSIWVGTTLTIALTRKKFPDEERGVRNLVMTACGFEPPGIPAPAALQPSWSGGRLQRLSPTCEYERLNLSTVVNQPSDGPDRS
jgi:hypothetical protein